MKYNILKVARKYTECFKNFINYVKIVNKDEEYSLLSFSMKIIYGIETCEFTESIIRYGKQCVESLKSVVDVPKRVGSMSLCDRIAVVNATTAMWVASDLVSEKY